MYEAASALFPPNEARSGAATIKTHQKNAPANKIRRDVIGGKQYSRIDDKNQGWINSGLRE
jgi:hypothetical protein